LLNKFLDAPLSRFCRLTTHRPNLLVNLDDERELVIIRAYKKLNGTASYNFITPGMF
jgi:hypothetical protein